MLTLIYLCVKLFNYAQTNQHPSANTRVHSRAFVWLCAVKIRAAFNMTASIRTTKTRQTHVTNFYGAKVAKHTNRHTNIHMDL